MKTSYFTSTSNRGRLGPLIWFILLAATVWLWSSANICALEPQGVVFPPLPMEPEEAGYFASYMIGGGGITARIAEIEYDHFIAKYWESIADPGSAVPHQAAQIFFCKISGGQAEGGRDGIMLR